MKTKRTAAGTTKSAVQAVAVGFPEPPKTVRLTRRERPFWDAVVRARLPHEWAGVDLLHVAQLVRAMCDLEQYRRLMLRDKVEDEARLRQIERLSKRSLSLTRILQLHAVPKFGQTDKMGAGKAEAMKVSDALMSAEADDLLARPTVQ